MQSETPDPPQQLEPNKQSPTLTVFSALCVPLISLAGIFLAAAASNAVPATMQNIAILICLSPVVASICFKVQIPKDKLLPVVTPLLNCLAWVAVIYSATLSLRFENNTLDFFFKALLCGSPILMLFDMLFWPSKMLTKSIYGTLLALPVLGALFFCLIGGLSEILPWKDSVKRITVGKHTLELRSHGGWNGNGGGQLLQVRNVMPGVEQTRQLCYGYWVSDVKQTDDDNVSFKVSSGAKGVIDSTASLKGW